MERGEGAAFILLIKLPTMITAPFVMCQSKLEVDVLEGLKKSVDILLQVSIGQGQGKGDNHLRLRSSLLCFRAKFLPIGRSNLFSPPTLVPLR